MNKSLFLLLMLYVCNGAPIRGKTRFVKLMYIAGRKLQKSKKTVDFYNFIRYYYGPFASELVSDLDFLIERNLVNHVLRENRTDYGTYEENVYQITDNGIMALETNREEIPFFQKIFEIFTEVKETYNNIPLSMLIQKIYFKYPLSKTALTRQIG